MTDYSQYIVHANAYLKQAEEHLGKREWGSALTLLRMCDTEVRKVVQWVDGEIDK